MNFSAKVYIFKKFYQLLSDIKKVLIFVREIKNYKLINMRTANYTELRTGLKAYLDTVVHNREPLIVHRSYNNSVVIISLDDYNAMSETAYIASSPSMMERINSAEQNINEGKGLKISIDDL
jgi:antitoxin YefM